jgi:hypothetical protein
VRSFDGSAVARAGWCILLAASLAACGSAASLLGFTQDPGHCGPPPPVPAPFLFFAYPGDGATGVPTTVGRLVFGGFPGSSSAISMTAAPQNDVQVGPLAPAPSPLPSPLATQPPRGTGSVPYYAVSVPTLAPSTTYTVVHTYSAWSSSPPCTQTEHTALGSFTTQ